MRVEGEVGASEEESRVEGRMMTSWERESEGRKKVSLSEREEMDGKGTEERRDPHPGSDEMQRGLGGCEVRVLRRS